MAVCTNSSSLILAEPAYLTSNPGRACVISTNFTTSSDGTNIFSSAGSTSGESVFQSCCGTDVPVATYTSGNNCGFAYCNVTSQAAQDGFTACLNQTAKGVMGKCFVNTAGIDNGSKSTSNSGALGKKELVSFGLMAALVVGVGGLGLA
ncbi:hypothetical protein G7Y89_g15682 [Cudoniella acicularis]|uniref:Uncharacterized protein n=1 Tax=Cudoniella acicularis TaxID=354080 RepID=A0A8H4QIE1_9HELO|nr:hypothetical protein G7Y89_g15682 [Cudoniella acicularis]